MSKILTVLVEIDGKEASDNKSYAVDLAHTLTLEQARASLQPDLQLAGRWSFVSNASVMAASAEKVHTIADLIKANGKDLVVIRRVRPSSERTKEELAAAKKESDDEHDRAELRREKEELKLRAHADQAMKALVDLQKSMSAPGPLMPPGSVDVVFKALEKAAVISAHGGATGQSLRELDLPKIEALVRSLGLPRTTSRAPDDGTFTVNEIVARLQPERDIPGEEGTDPVKTIARKYVVAVNEVDTRVETFQEEWEKKAAESGFSQIAASMKVAYSNLVVKAAAAASYQRSQQSEAKSADRKETIYLVGIQEVRKARIHTPPGMVVLDRLVEEQFAEASLLGADALKPMFDRHGYFVITEYTLGGKLYTSEKEEKLGSTLAAANKFQQGFGAALDAQYGGASAEASAAMLAGNDANTASASSKQSANFHLSAKGGNVTDRNNPKVWTESLAPLNWEVIAYGRLIPIYEFLRDPLVRERCRNAVREYARADAAALAATDAKAKRAYLERWAVYSYGNERQQAAQRLRPASLISGRPFRDEAYHVSTEWVRVPAGSYFRGAKLHSVNDWMGLALITTDDTHEQENDITSTMGGGLDRKFGDNDIYIDTNMLWIPRGKRILAIRLCRLTNPSNRIGLEIEVGDMNGQDTALLHHNGDDQEYMKAEGTRNAHPCTRPTLVPADMTVAGIRLVDLGHDNMLGIEIAAVPLT